MKDPTDTRIRRGLLVLAAASLCLSLAGPAVSKPKPEGGGAKQQRFTFEPGTDISSWYWSRQVDEEVTTPVDLPPPIPPASQRVRLPNPQRPDTIAVALNQGEPEKVSAVKFELLERGVTDGSKISKLLLFIEESVDRNEQPSIQPETAKIQACQILDFLPQGENEQLEDAPEFSDADCAEGTRDAVAGATPVWTFDLTKIAQVWGKRSFDNNGVMLAPVVEAGRTWQVNLKVPRKENPAEEGDQYELTKNRAFITIDYVPGEAPEIEEIEVPEDTTTLPAAGGGVGASTFPTSPGVSSGSPLISPSTDLTGGSSGIPGAEIAPVPAPTEQAGFGIPQEQGPPMPAYVWLAIPLGLLALSAVRSVILEPVGGPRPDGVISAIRRRNAQRRGGALAQGTGGFLAGVTAGIKRGTGSIGKALSSATRIVRRKR
jgi:hypothetical protein